MEFCKECKGILTISGDKAICTNCGLISENIELIAKHNLETKKEVPIIEDEKQVLLPKIHHPCKKCGEEFAYFSHRNEIGDEADSVFYQCVKCGYATKSGGQRGGR